MRHGGRILADNLARLGARRAFSVPGESFLALLDGFHDTGLENVVCRHEGAAAMMAEAHGKLTGTPGLCIVTRGPGATNASAGVHVARQDSTPLILLVGQIDRGHRDREAFQEVDFRAMFAPLAKWAAEVDDTARLPEYLGRAWDLALSGRPGPVVLSLPEDVLNGAADVSDLRGPTLRARPDWGPAAREAMAVLAGAERPLVVVGGPHWSAEAARDLQRFAEAQGLPVACGFRRQDRMDNRHPHYAGDLNVGVSPRLAQRLRDADALLLLGTRLGDIETGGYGLLDPRAHEKRLVHVHPDADEAGRVWRPDLAVAARADDFVAALAALAGGGGMARLDRRRARRLRVVGHAQGHARPRSAGGRDGLAVGQPPRGRDRDQRRGQLRGLPPPLLRLQGLRDPARADLGQHGLRLPGRRRGLD
jgi:acetolactate synthase-1/2/3 large subunit